MLGHGTRIERGHAGGAGTWGELNQNLIVGADLEGSRAQEGTLYEKEGSGLSSRQRGRI